MDTVNNELMHYGVLGMKWGVRKDASRAHVKASKKLRKLDEKLQKRTIASDKVRGKAEMAKVKAATAVFGYERKARKAAKLDVKATRVSAKLHKQRAKAMNWYKQMEKTFKDVDVGDVSSEDLAIGKKYAEMSMNYLLKD